MWTKRGKACLILIFSTNTNCEDMAYRSFRSEKCSARGVRKVTTGITTEGLSPRGLLLWALLLRSPPKSLFVAPRSAILIAGGRLPPIHPHPFLHKCPQGWWLMASSVHSSEKSESWKAELLKCWKLNALTACVCTCVFLKKTETFILISACLNF